MSSAPTLKLTYEDYLKFPEDRQRHELLGGEHVVTPAPSRRHQRISGRVHFHLFAHLRANGSGEVYAAPTDVLLSGTTVVEPDLLVVARERLEGMSEKYVEGAPDLVVEILSDTTRRRDEVTKREIYERFGVREYWLFDPETEAVKVFRLAASGRLERVAVLAAQTDDRLTSPLLPGLEIELRDIFK